MSPTRLVCAAETARSISLLVLLVVGATALTAAPAAAQSTAWTSAFVGRMAATQPADRHAIATPVVGPTLGSAAAAKAAQRDDTRIESAITDPASTSAAVAAVAASASDPQQHAPVLPTNGQLPKSNARVTPSAFKSPAMVPLFGSYVALQVLDIHSTLQVIRNGGEEGNLFVAPFAGKPAGLVAFKAGMTTLALWNAARLWKHNKAVAIGVMVASNVVYGLVARHNYQLAHELGGR